MKNAIVTANKKEELAKIKNMYPNKMISESNLRVDASVTSDLRSIIFDLKQTGNEIFPERRLNRNDVFVVTGIGLALRLTQTSGKEGQGVLYPFPATNLNATGVPFVAADAAALEAIYNGYLGVKKGTEQIMEGLSTLNFRYNPSSNVRTDLIFNDIHVSDWIYQLPGVLPIEGNVDTEIKIDFGSLSGLSVATHKVVLLLDGFLIKSATKD
jgi:hypothetical protein